MDCKDHSEQEPPWHCQCTRVKIENMDEALDFAHGAILEAITSEDGLDGVTGDRVVRMIEAVKPSLSEFRNNKEPL